MKSLKDQLVNEGLDAFTEFCCERAIALYYAYITKHSEHVGDGEPSLEQLEKVYLKVGGVKPADLKKWAKKLEDRIK